MCLCWAAGLARYFITSFNTAVSVSFIAHDISCEVSFLFFLLFFPHSDKIIYLNTYLQRASARMDLGFFSSTKRALFRPDFCSCVISEWTHGITEAHDSRVFTLHVARSVDAAIRSNTSLFPVTQNIQTVFCQHPVFSLSCIRSHLLFYETSNF